MAKAKYTYNPVRKEWYTLVYDGTLTPTGAKHRKRITSKKSSADLEKKVIVFKQKLESGDTLQLSNITFGEYSKEWFELYKSNKELNTQRMYKSCVYKYLSPLDSIRLIDIKHSHFQKIINEI